MIRPIIVGQHIFERLMATMVDERGVHLESIATVIGALAGYASQQAALDGHTRKLREYKKRGVNVVTTNDGGTYLFGDGLNWPLLERPTSFWSLAAGATAKAGSQLPDIHEAVGHSARTLGGPDFGVPRFAPGSNSGITPRQALEFWEPLMSPVVAIIPDRQQWPIALGIAAQRLVVTAAAGQVHDVTSTLRGMLDSALTTAKITDARLAPAPAT